MPDVRERLYTVTVERMCFAQALAWYEGALAEVRALRPDFDADWLEDLEPDFAIARAVNGLASLTSELDRHGIRFMLIGGQAVLLHGEARFTADVDITLDAGPAALSDLRAACDTLHLTPVVPASESLETFVRRTFVLPARHAATGIRVDFIFSTTPYETEAVAGARRWTGRTSSAGPRNSRKCPAGRGCQRRSHG